MDGGPASPVKLRVTERRIMALELRKQGGSYRQIAATLREVDGVSSKYSEGAAYGDVITSLRELNSRTAELAEENRRLELERLDELFSVYYERALKGDTFALQACLSIMGKRAALLGLNAPVNINQTTVNVSMTSDDYAKARDRAAAFENELLEDSIVLAVDNTSL